MLRQLSVAVRSTQGCLASSVRFGSTSAENEFQISLKGHAIEDLPKTAVATKDELLAYYRTMYLYRRMEIAADVMYKSQQIRGFCHLYDGQEAIGVGMEAVLTKQDAVVTGYRDHCTALARGYTVKQVLAELAGKLEGATKGKGGSMHFYNKEHNFYGGHGIVGSTGPLGTGLAFAQKYNKTNHVTVSLYGDGAAMQGQLREAMNIAALWALPIIYVCENNKFGMGTAITRSAANNMYYTHGDTIPGILADGMDVLSVRSATDLAVTRAREGMGPFVLEFDTYRYHGHSMSDPGLSYRSRDEVAGVRKERDPIARVKKELLTLKWASEEEIKAIDAEIRAEVEEAVDFANNVAQAPPESELYTHVFVGENDPPFIRGVELCNSHGKSDY